MDFFLGGIVPFGFNFSPRGWIICDGQLLSISENQAVFALLGTFFGGDGRATFGIPDLRGRALYGMGTGLGLRQINRGEMAGSQKTTFNVAQMPVHNHNATFTGTGGSGAGTPIEAKATVHVHDGEGNQNDASGGFWATSAVPGRAMPPNVNSYSSSSSGADTMATGAVTIDVTGGGGSGITGGTVAVGNTGGSELLEIQSPLLGINYSIALQGIFPSRN